MLDRGTSWRPTDALTSCTFSSVFTYLRRPCYSVLSLLSVCPIRFTNIQTVFVSGTALLHGIMDLCQKALFESQPQICYFQNTPQRKSSTFSQKIIVSTKMGSTTNHNETIFIHTYPKYSPSNCLVYSAAPHSYCCKAVTPAPCLKALLVVFISD